MSCCNKMNDKRIIIVRNNDTDFNNAKFLTINLNTEILDLSNFKATFTLCGVTKYFEDISTGKIEVNFTNEETKTFLPICNGVLNLIDKTDKVATIESLIPFKVISTVHNNAIATEPYTLNFDVKQGGETILTVNVESAVSVEVGTTTMLPAGSNATVTNVGTDNHLVLNFGIPRGGVDSVNGKTGVVVLTASDVGALPSNTQIGNGTITLTQGGTQKGVFTLNQTGNVTIDFSTITVDSVLSTSSTNPVQNKVITTELNKKLESITSSDVTTALGYTPYNSSNPSGYITNSAIANMQVTTNLVTSVSSASTNSQYPSAKLFYDTCGDIETLINAL